MNQNQPNKMRTKVRKIKYRAEIVGFRTVEIPEWMSYRRIATQAKCGFNSVANAFNGKGVSAEIMKKIIRAIDYLKS